MNSTLSETNFTFPEQSGFYRGKVREVYEIAGDYLVMIASDRISAFDYILPRAIPCKGAILNTIAAKFLEMTKEIVSNWLLDVPDPRVSIGLRCEAYPVEMVIRGYLCGHALREYSAGKRLLCGVPMPDGMKPYDAFPQPIITPSTKAKEGHDEDISREEIIERGLVSENEYLQLETYTRKLYTKGSEYAASMGLILADTKYEFGKREGHITLIDEIHTPDSSRYFYEEGFSENLANGGSPKQLSKEFVREWLMANGFQGRSGETIPEMTDAVVEMITNRYMELFEAVTGDKFNPSSLSNDTELQERIEKSLQKLVYSA